MSRRMSTAAGSLALSVHAEATCITTDAHQLLVVAKLTGAPRAMRAQTAADACDSLRPRATGAQAHVRGAAEASAAESEVDDDDHVSLEQCGLGWRVCKPLRRRSPWALAAQRVTMRVETSSGARVEQLCLLEPAAMYACVRLFLARLCRLLTSSQRRSLPHASPRAPLRPLPILPFPPSPFPRTRVQRRGARGRLC